jgi:hypothetical protein
MARSGWFMRKMRKGAFEPICEKHVIRALGIVQPKSL